MKRSGVFIILAILLLTFFIAQKIDNDSSINGYIIKEGTDARVQVSEDVTEEIEKGNNVRVYIKFKDSAVGKRGIASDVKAEIEESINIRHEFNDKVSAIVSEEELEELKNNSNIESIDIVGTREIVLQDSVGMISANETWNVQLNGINLTGIGQTICIIDTGVNYSHPSLGGCFGTGCKVIGGIDYCADNIWCNTTDSDPMDAHYHGTHVSGIAAANGSIKGVAPGANLVVIKASNSTGTFWDDDIAEGIDWCVDNASVYNISVISMSLGDASENSDYCNSDPLADEIDNAVSNGIAVVIASGNTPASTTYISAPACVESAIPIGSIQKDDSTFDYRRNSLVQLIVPGVNINSTIPSGYGLLSGTSMATPHAAGAIALISQFRALEGSSEYTPSQMEDALNDSGFRIYDAGSGVTYSRIDIYTTLLEIDESAPEVTIISPSDNHLNASGNQTLICSAEDALQLENLTFYLWNSSNYLIDETNVNATNNSLEWEIDVSLSNGTYKWNCLSYDSKGNNDYGSDSNYTLKIGATSVNLSSPSNNTYKKVNLTSFSCSVQNSVANLTNTTLKIWNSLGTLVYNSTESVSGVSNQSNFTYNLSSNGKYLWNCYSYDSQLNILYADSNNTITFDTVAPVITLSEPDDEDEVDTGSVAFKFTVTDGSSIANCSLILDEDIESTDTTITVNATNTITKTMSAGDYDWEIECYDSAGNYGTSSEITLSVSSSSDEDEEEESTTDDLTTKPVLQISDADIVKGIGKFVKAGYILKFNINGKSHSLLVDSLTEQ
ncbi:MAG TPA: S8 family serine peptidase, partial [Candidatus Nanoarchaeia archaeon]|nr:S8 family serine peptidase [Candidatus Nanoarchaeia archaeon]